MPLCALSCGAAAVAKFFCYCKVRPGRNEAIIASAEAATIVGLEFWMVTCGTGRLTGGAYVSACNCSTISLLFACSCCAMVCTASSLAGGSGNTSAGLLLASAIRF